MSGYRPSPDRREERGPFDIIGDVHGCLDELQALLAALGYGADGAGPPGRKLVFVGDLVDRGPDAAGVLRLIMALCASGEALCVPGNHDEKFRRWLAGRDVKLTHGLAETVVQVSAEPSSFRRSLALFYEALPNYLWLDGGALVVTHAGIRASMVGTMSGEVRAFCLFGNTTGEYDEYGLPIRLDWALQHPGTPAIVYGHTPVATPVWVNNTLCIDTGCCFGGHLTALRWPERELVSVPARQTYAISRRPFRVIDGASAERAP